MLTTKHNSGWANNIPVSRYSYINVYETTLKEAENQLICGEKKNSVHVRACKLELAGSSRLAIGNQSSRSPDCSYAGARGSSGSLELIANCPLATQWWIEILRHVIGPAPLITLPTGQGSTGEVWRRLIGRWADGCPPSLPLSRLMFTEQKVVKRGVGVRSP